MLPSMGNVIEFNPAKRKVPPTRQELVGRLRELAKDSWNMDMPSPHLKERMQQRGKSMRDILETIAKGEAIKGPDLDQYGDYRLKLRRCVCGKRTQVVVAVREKDFSVITVF